MLHFTSMKNTKKLFQGVFLAGILFLGAQHLFANTQGDGVLISEVEYDPAHGGGDQSYEWFELFNPTAHDIDLSGYQFTDGEGTVTIPNGTTIPAGSYFLAVFDTNDFHTEHAGITPDLEYGNLSGASSVNFGNSGDELTLRDGVGNNVDFVSWENHTAGWNVVASQGQSIARNTSVDTDSVADWDGHQTPTPGTGNLSIINHAPDITSDGGSANATIHIDENSSVVTTVVAGDPDAGDTIHYSISGGADSALFSIDTNTGALTVTPLDYEHATDANGDGVYEVEVQASDGFLSDTQHISVVLDDVPESSSSSHVRHHRRSRRISKAKLLAIFRRREEGPRTNSQRGEELSGESVEESRSRMFVFVYTRPLSYGASGEDVRALQHILNALGFSAGEEDGIFGEKTRAAVARFQEAKGISVDGIFGRESALRLMERG